MIERIGVRSFQKYMTRYINGDSVVVIEDAKTHKEKGVYMPYGIYELFTTQIDEAVKKDMINSFTESFDGVSVAS